MLRPSGVGLKTQYEQFFVLAFATQCASNDPGVEAGRGAAGAVSRRFMSKTVMGTRRIIVSSIGETSARRTGPLIPLRTLRSLPVGTQWDVFCPKMPNTKAIIVNLSDGDAAVVRSSPILIKLEILFAPDVALFDVLFWRRKLCRCGHAVSVQKPPPYPPPPLRSLQMKRVRARGPSGVRLSHGA